MKIDGKTSASEREPRAKQRAAVTDDTTTAFLAALSALLPRVAPRPTTPPTTPPPTADSATSAAAQPDDRAVAATAAADLIDGGADPKLASPGIEPNEPAPPTSAHATELPPPSFDSDPAPIAARAALPADFTIEATTPAVTTNVEADGKRERDEARAPRPSEPAAPVPSAPTTAHAIAPASGDAARSSSPPSAPAAATHAGHAAAVSEPPPAPAAAHARASLTVGDGADRVDLTISASGHHVRVSADTPSAALAGALQRSGDELRDALRHHGLTLTELSAGTRDGAPSHDPREADDAPQERGGRTPSTSTNREGSAPAPAAGRVLV